MDATTVSTQILDIRERLRVIAQKREELPGDAFAAKAELIDEEHELDAELAALREEAARAGAEFHD